MTDADGNIWQNGNKQAMTRVYFRWASADVKDTEEVRVVGSCWQLGNWQPNQGVVLTADTTFNACWTSTVGVSLPIAKAVQYRYVVCDCQTGSVSWWDPHPEERVVVPTGFQHTLEDDNGELRRQSYDAVNANEKAKAAGRKPSKLRPIFEKDTLDIVASPMQPEDTKFTILPEWVRDDVCVTDDDEVVVVFRFLPLTVSRDESGSWRVNTTRLNTSSSTAPFIVTLLEQAMKEGTLGFKVKFIGDPGVHQVDEEERKKIAEALAPYNCIPVFITETLARANSDFCNRFLWLVMNNMKVPCSSQSENEVDWIGFEESAWKSFQDLNKAFAETICKYTQSRALIWIHNYYLMLTPRYVRLRRQESAIAFFMHCPFPSSEVFRCLPCRSEILKSLLSCNVVAFQIFEYARHFLNTCQLILNATHSFAKGGVLQVEHDSRSIVVLAEHAVLPHKWLLSRLVASSEIQSQAQQLRDRFKGKHIVGCIDHPSHLAGLKQKLRAFGRFLQENHSFAHSVVLVQHVLLGSADDKATIELLADLEQAVDELNQCFARDEGAPVITLTTGDLSLDEKMATLKAIDILLETCLSDGLNLIPFMYYAAHSEDRVGAVIVSEFSGCSSVLTGALKVNPWSAQSIADGLDKVLMRNAVERDAAFLGDLSYVSEQTLVHWVQHNLSELKRQFTTAAQPDLRGLDADFRVLTMRAGFAPLPFDDVLRDYRKAKSRVLLFDSEGTLAPDRRKLLQAYGRPTLLRREGTPPDPQVLRCLQALANDEHNLVVVLSGREPSTVDSWFGGVDGLGLCAEHGFYWVLPGRLRQVETDKSSSRWHSMAVDSQEDDDWKEVVCELFKQYVRRVQGSTLNYKGSAIAWYYREVGAPQLAKQIALELVRFLNPADPEGLLHGYPVVVVSGAGYVEVKRRDVDKGVSIMRVLDHMEQKLSESPDFILCIGDDRSDEDMFEAINSLLGLSEPPTPVRFGNATRRRFATDRGGDEKNANKMFYTVTVGRKPSNAMYFARDVLEVSDLLEKISSQGFAAAGRHCQSLPSFAAFQNATESDSDS